MFDAHKVLQSQVGSYNFTFSQVGLQPIHDNNSVVKYNSRIGYEYNPNYRFINTFKYPITTYGSNRIIYITNNFNLVYGPTSYDIGDYNGIVGVDLFVGTKFSVLDGVNNGILFTIVSITSYPPTTPSVFTVDKLWHDNGGTTTYPFNLTIYTDPITVNYLGLDFVDPNLLIPGDQINIQMDNTNFNGSYNGLSTVIGTNGLSVPGSPVLSINQSITDILYGLTPSTPEQGTVNLLLRTTNSTNYVYGFPGTRQYTEKDKDFGTTNDISYGKFATNYTGIKQIFLNQYETISLMSLSNIWYYCKYVVKTYDGNFNLLNTYTSSDVIGGTDKSIKYELGTGTKQLQGWNMSGTPIDLGTASYYSVGLVNTSPVFNAVFTYSIIPNCSKYDNIRIMFQNRVGGYDYWNFNYDSKWTIDITRTLFTKQLDYNYKIGDRGRTILNIDANVMWQANTDIITESDYAFLQELTTSSDVYVIDEVNNYKLPINIEDTQYVQKTINRDKIFNLTITYRYAYDLNLSGS